MFEKLRICLVETALCFSEALDLVSPQVVDHHKRVACLAARIAAEAGFPEEDRGTILLAGLLHDLGALSPRERLEALAFDLEDHQAHAERGYELIRGNELFEEAAAIIRYHHLPWARGAGAELAGEPVPRGSHLLHLADRVAVLLDAGREVLAQAPAITERIVEGAGERFEPLLVDAFRRVAATECFWFDAVSPGLGQTLLRQRLEYPVELRSPQLLGLTRLFSHIIDCRSRFTANHSSGVAAVAGRLADLVGLSGQERSMIEIAGYLHDLGKLAVPAEILEKPGRLSAAEVNVVRRHPYDTFRILAPVEGLRTIAKWGALHHESLDGRGYPFHYRGDNLPLGARIMAVADVFTALSEDRPYRSGMRRAELARTLEAMAREEALDGALVALAATRHGDMEDARRSAQEPRDRG